MFAPDSFEPLGSKSREPTYCLLAERGALLAVAAVSQQATQLEPPPESAMRVLAATIRDSLPRALSAQLAPQFREWCTVISAAEAIGETQIAKVIAVELLRVVTATGLVEQVPAYAAVCWAILGSIHGQEGHLSVSEDCSRRARALVRDQPIADGWATATNNLTVALAIRGRYDIAGRYARQVLRHPERAMSAELAKAHFELASCERVGGRVANAIVHCRLASELWEADSEWQVHVYVQLGLIALHLEDAAAARLAFARARDRVDSGKSIWPAIGLARTFVFQFRTETNPILLRALRVEAQSLLAELRSARAQQNILHDRLSADIAIAQLMGWMGDRDAAHEMLATVEAEASAGGHHAVSFRAESQSRALTAQAPAASDEDSVAFWGHPTPEERERASSALRWLREDNGFGGAEDERAPNRKQLVLADRE